MLAKLTRGNQITIPKLIVKKAGLKTERDFLDVKYANGVIQMKPVEIEERICPEAFEKFQKASLKINKGDILVSENKSKSFLSKQTKKK